MKSNQKFFKKSKFLPVDNFFENILYDNQFGYYATKQPFGRDGDFITSPKVSNLFSSPYFSFIGNLGNSYLFFASQFQDRLPCEHYNFQLLH